MATQALHCQPRFPRLEILLQIHSFPPCRLVSVLATGHRAPWDLQGSNAAGPTELRAGGSGHGNGLAQKALEILVTPFDKISPGTAMWHCLGKIATSQRVFFCSAVMWWSWESVQMNVSCCGSVCPAPTAQSRFLPLSYKLHQGLCWKETLCQKSC